MQINFEDAPFSFKFFVKGSNYLIILKVLSTKLILSHSLKLFNNKCKYLDIYIYLLF